MTPTPTFSVEHELDSSSDGEVESWIVVDGYRGSRDPVARCYSDLDAILVADALNLAFPAR